MIGGPGLLLLPLLAGLGAALTGLPENVRVEGIDTIYLLKWDWDYRKNPNVTFSVKESLSAQSSWRPVEGCENITASPCNVSSIEPLYTYKFLVSVYNKETDERYSNVATFRPIDDTVIGPPTNLHLTVQNNDLHITVVPPEGFHSVYLRDFCTWEYHLERWKNSTPTQVTYMQNIGIHFIVKAVEASTTYCARAYTKCKADKRSGLYSEIYCTTTAPRSYIKQWIIGSVLGAIIVISVILYICLCPLKRFLKHIFFPKSKLPSSIEKGLQDSPQHYIKKFCMMYEEEATDRCYIMQNSPEDADVTIVKNGSEADVRDSGNYSNEDEVTGDSTGATQ